MSKRKSVTDTLINIKQIYKKLPYIAIKNYSKYYIVPQKPKRPLPYTIQLINKYIKQQQKKYNQFFRPEDFAEKIKYKNKMESLTEQQIKENQQKYQQFYEKLTKFAKERKQYNDKYILPLKIMNTNGYFLFRSHQASKMRQQRETKLKIINEQDKKQQQQSEQVTINSQKFPNTQQKYMRGLKQLNKYNLGSKWSNLSQQQKQYFRQLQRKLREQNKQIISKFIQNHQVPRVKKYRTINAFTSKYASKYQLKLSDKKLYKIYSQLSLQQKKKLSQQTIQMNIQQKKKFDNFLQKWNITQVELKNIIQISDKYKKLFKIQKTKSRRKTLGQMDQFDIQDQEDQNSIEGLDTQNNK